MTTGFDMHKADNEACSLRYELAVERLKELPQELEQELADEGLREFFRWAVKYGHALVEIMEMIEQNNYLQQSLEALKSWNKRLYQDYEPDNYDSSWLSPGYAKGKMGDQLGSILCAFAYELTNSAVVYTFRGNRYLLTTYLEQLLQFYHMAVEKVFIREWEESWYYFISDYREDRCVEYYNHDFNPAFAAEIGLLMGDGVRDVRVLYGYGLCVSEREWKVADSLSKLSEEEVFATAQKYTNCFYENCLAEQIDCDKKIVQIHYPMGLERIVHAILEQFAEKGISATFKVSARGANPQVAFDHQYDEALVMDQDYAEISRDTVRFALENIRECLTSFGGQVKVDVQEESIDLVQKSEALTFNEKQKKLVATLRKEIESLHQEYIQIR